jgi:hypothetical protein
LTGLVKKIDQRLEAATGKTPRALGAYVIFENAGAGLDNQLRGLAEKEAIKRVSLCIGAPRDDYEIAKTADITVVIYNAARRGQQKVTANFALRKGELTETRADAIVEALSNMLPR